MRKTVCGVYATEFGKGELPVSLEGGDLLFHRFLVTAMGEPCSVRMRKPGLLAACSS
ncbi:uncharacterized protein FOBCDRAFT_224587 [Fusarium oxysporum Fo47]|uniref:uncharacterized protein n=1 Tax=Fusarium oxysporum Fo47 TaxID=660027 RepID=UPI0028699FC9|nr:uncharacterized protein FOBCDRAFT_224587 [Fusarium oxysporum Fo47]WJG35388.1 hypothetical protein FOBCDRAFT_224587 [Fusarium oxysporum Fo47]